MSQPPSQSEHRLSQLRQLPLEPVEYCQRWVAAAPGKGYLKVAINALAEATGLSPGTIRNWEPDFRRRPQYALRLLRQADLLNQIQQLDQAGEISIPEDALQD
jgi:AcrR family transcriptional regulator